MARPTILYDATNGADTTGSGAGPTIALTGSNAITGTTDGLTINLDGTPNLSQVTGDGSHAIWFNNTAGQRHIYRITGVDDGADQVQLALSGVDVTGIPWAIGGKRKTMINDTTRQDWEDIEAGWTFEFGTGSYVSDTDIIPVLGDQVAGPTTFRATTGIATKPEISVTSSSSAKFVIDATKGPGNINLIGLRILGTNFRPCIKFSGNNCIAYVENCELILDGSTCYGIYMNSSLQCTVINTIFEATSGTDSYGIIRISGQHRVLFYGCRFKNIVGRGLDFRADNIDFRETHISVSSSIFENCSTGVDVGGRNNGHVYGIIGCTIDGGYDGITVNNDGGTGSARSSLNIFNNLITNNTNYGVNAEADTDSLMVGFRDYNAFYNNTAGNYNNMATGTNDVILTADPYVDSVAGDYTLNNNAGGGALLIGSGFPQVMP